MCRKTGERDGGVGGGNLSHPGNYHDHKTDVCRCEVAASTVAHSRDHNVLCRRTSHCSAGAKPHCRCRSAWFGGGFMGVSGVVVILLWVKKEVFASAVNFTQE